MTDQRSKGGKGGKDEPDLDRVLRELRRDVLDEPIPERLLRVLHRARKGTASADEDPPASPDDGEEPDPDRHTDS